MGWWLLLLTVKFLAFLRLTVIFFLLRLTKNLKINLHCFKKLKIKTESIRKLSNQWTKTLYQNNLKFIAFFFTLFKTYRRN